MAEILAEADEADDRYEERLQQVLDQAEAAIAPTRSKLLQPIDRLNEAPQPFRDQAQAIESEAAAELQLLSGRLAEQQAAYERVRNEFDPELPDRPEAECTADRGESAV